MLEAEARTKYCPVQMGDRTDEYRYTAEWRLQRRETIHHLSYCVGAQCVLWTWQSGSKTEGYCGMAGRVLIP